jgi:hypothetical protein
VEWAWLRAFSSLSTTWDGCRLNNDLERSGGASREEQRLQPARQAHAPGGLTDREQRTLDVGTSARASLMTEVQPLVGMAEDNLRRHGVAWQLREWIWTPSTVAPRASTGPATSSGAMLWLGVRTRPIRSASSRDVPPGTSDFSALA